MQASRKGVDWTRRRLLQGKLEGPKRPPRPPWAVDEARFIELCTRCDDCIRACEDGLLVRGAGGFPEIRFTEYGCNFCGDCLQACRTHALSAPHPAPSLAWRWRAQITERCLSLRGIVCRSCGDACDTDAIRFRLEVGGRATPMLDIDACNGCGECLAICPEDAVALVEPEPLQEETG